MVKEKEAVDDLIIEKPCKFFMNNMKCLNQLTWGRCKYLHIDKLKLVANMIQAKMGTPEIVCEILNTSKEEKVAFCKAIRFHLRKPTEAECQ